jgi:hypothetical protein
LITTADTNGNHHFITSSQQQTQTAIITSSLSTPALQESKRNILKDFVSVAGPLGVTHFLMLTATEKSSYLKLCKSPRVSGATLCLHAVQCCGCCPCLQHGIAR